MEGLDHVEGSFEIGVEDGVPVFGFHPHDEVIAGDAGVIDEDVDAAEVGDDLFSGFLDGVEVGDIKPVESCGVRVVGVNGFRGGAAAGFVSGDEGELGSLAGEGFSNG